MHISWFPGIFNLADSAITVGVVMLPGYLMIFGENRSPDRAGAGDEALLGELLNPDQWPQRDRQ